MKRILLAAVASAGLIVSLNAHAQTWWNGPEVGVQGGYGWGTSSGRWESWPGGAALSPHYTTSPDGWMAGGHTGYNWQWGPWVLGVEGDAEGGDLFAHDHFVSVVPGISETKSRLDFDASARGKIGFAFDRVLVYGTGGLAIGDVRTTYEAPIGPGSVFAPGTAHPDEIRVGWTGGAGVGYAITPNWSTNLEYRYTDLGSFHFVSEINGFQDHNSFNYNMIRLGITYRFAIPLPPPPMAPAPMPAAAPAMAPPPMARTFLVFFDFDKYNLTVDARRVIEAAAASYKANGVARIEVSGYTDLAGTQAYNLRLSRRRADAVAAYLMRQGVTRSAMDVKWFGKEHPRVPTPDGVREPQNRRVEIVMP